MSKATSNSNRSNFIGIQNWIKNDMHDKSTRQVNSSEVYCRLICTSLRAASIECKGCKGLKTCPTFAAVYENLKNYNIVNPTQLAKMFTRAYLCITAHTERKIHLLDKYNSCTSLDESIVISLIAACQHNQIPTAEYFSKSLLQSNKGISCIVNNMDALSKTLENHEIILSQQTLDHGLYILKPYEGTC